MGYLASFFFIYVVGSELARRLPAVIFIRRLYGGLAGQYGGVKVYYFFPTFLPYRALGSLTSNPIFFLGFSGGGRRSGRIFSNNSFNWVS